MREATLAVGKPGLTGAPGTTADRNPGLDAVRATAIGMVVASHIGTAYGHPAPLIRSALDTMGQAGVELFFSLSGFLIGGILIRLSETPLRFRGVLRFMARRWFRTLPLYYLVLLGVGAAFDMDIRHSLLLTQNFFPAEPRALPVSWSLVMEEYFYVAFPLIMLALARLGGRGPGLVVATALGLIVGCTSVRLWNAYGYGPGWPAPYVHENPLLRLDCAAYGVMGAWLTRRVPTLMASGHGRSRWAAFAAGLLVAIAAALLLVWVLGASVEQLVAAGFLRWGPAFLASQPTLFDIGFAMVVVAMASVRWAGPRLVSGLILWISLISYSVYLLHLVVIDEVARWTALPPLIGASAALVAAGMLSTLTYLAVERPFLTLRDRLLSR